MTELERVVDGEIVVRPRAGELVETAADRTLSEETLRRLERSVPESTRRNYDRALREYSTWCRSEGRTALPGTAETLAEYLAHLAESGRGAPTLEQHMAAIRTAHRLAGYEGQPGNGLARQILRDHRRNEGARRVRRVEPITLRLLQQILDVPTFDLDTLIGQRDRLILLLGIGAFLRRSELVALDFDDVTELPEGLDVYIAKSKTDQEATGTVVSVPRGRTKASGEPFDTDPCAALRRYRAMLADAGVRDGALFRSVSRHGRPGGRLSARAVAQVIQRRVGAVPGLDPAVFAGHSLRAGGATSAAEGGADAAAIQAQGRWITAAMPLLYVRRSDRWRDNAAGKIGF
ncbi:MAG: integrase family protein [Pseudonocardia sp.]|nr:integrase family protein [Pseudonocardia sp.]